jgi:myo-inositol-1(or 4)-monophosphatase
LRAADAAIDRVAIDAQLTAAVCEAGAFALQKFRSSFRSWNKAGFSPVSEVDIAVDEMLRARLCGAFPDFGWLSEEGVDDPARLAARHVWVVDPIDGTRGFINGMTDWAVSAALVEDGRPVVAALFAPAEEALFVANIGSGATLNGRPLRAPDGDGLSGLRVAGPKRRQDVLAALLPKVEPLPKVHSLALRIARVAAGTVDVAFAGGNCHDWDIAAADLIVHESGGALTALDGQRVVYNRPDPVHGALLAAGRARHGILLELLRTSPIGNT